MLPANKHLKEALQRNETMEQRNDQTNGMEDAVTRGKLWNPDWSCLPLDQNNKAWMVQSLEASFGT